MEEVTVDSFDGLNAFFDAHDRFEGWVFRGQANASWLLLPKIARSAVVQELFRILAGIRQLRAHSKEVAPDLAQTETELTEVLPTLLIEAENATLRYWRRLALRHLGNALTSDWQWLALGQHFGLATRLLDWTANPLAAAFFALASSGDQDSDAAVYALRCPSLVNEASEIASLNAIGLYRPPPIVDRIVLQHGLFSVSPPPFDALLTAPGDVGLARAIIPTDARPMLLRKVLSFDVDASTLFPDLGGAASHTNWLVDNALLVQRKQLSPHREFAKTRQEIEALVRSLPVHLRPSGQQGPAA